MKANQTAVAPTAHPETAKLEVSTTASTPAERSNTAPPSEFAKAPQVAAIPAATNNAAKTNDKPADKPIDKADDTSKSKTAVTAAVVSAPVNLPDKGKPDVSKTDSSKTPVLVENRAVPIGAPEKMMEIVLKNGRILRIGRDIEPDALARIILQLERL